MFLGLKYFNKRAVLSKLRQRQKKNYPCSFSLFILERKKETWDHIRQESIPTACNYVSNVVTRISRFPIIFKEDEKENSL